MKGIRICNHSLVMAFVMRTFFIMCIRKQDYVLDVILRNLLDKWEQ